MEWPPSLVQEVAERRVVFFVGAGFSKLALRSVNSDLPAWSELLTQLANALERPIDRKVARDLVKSREYLNAAQIIRDKMAGGDFSAKLREIFLLQGLGTISLYKILAKIDPMIIITTNYDQLIEKNIEDETIEGRSHNTCKYNQDFALDDIRSPIRSILKMHGCITEPQNVILDRRSYFRARQKYGSFFNLIESISTINTLIFLGYSLSDPDMQLILENVTLSHPTQHTHYALMPKFTHPSLKNIFSETYNMRFLEYEAGDHTQVSSLFERLEQEVTSFRAARGII